MCPRDVKQQEEPIVATRSGSAADLHQYDEKKLEATADMCHYCFDIILQELQKRSNTDRMIHKSSNKRKDATNSIVPIDEILPTLDASCPLFVTWDKKIPNKRRLSPEHTEGQEYQHCYELRGCIGTLTPRPLITALREYAVLSAFRDSRFEPIRSNEVSLLRVAVSLLVNYEDCDDAYDWVIGVHGILVKFEVRGTHYNATYLPEVAYEQGWTQEQTVRSLIRKAGYYGSPNEVLSPSNDSFQCIRYQSSKEYLTYDDYVKRGSQNNSTSSSSHNTSTISPPLASSSSESISSATSANDVEKSVVTKSKHGWRSCLPF